jgi:hypothetical protein
MSLFIDAESRDALARRLMALAFEVTRTYDQGSTSPGWIYVSDEAAGDIVAGAAAVLAPPVE